MLARQLAQPFVQAPAGQRQPHLGTYVQLWQDVGFHDACYFSLQKQLFSCLSVLLHSGSPAKFQVSSVSERPGTAGLPRGPLSCRTASKVSAVQRPGITVVCLLPQIIPLLA